MECGSTAMVRGCDDRDRAQNVVDCRELNVDAIEFPPEVLQNGGHEVHAVD